MSSDQTQYEEQKLIQLEDEAAKKRYAEMRARSRHLPWYLAIIYFLASIAFIALLVQGLPLFATYIEGHLGSVTMGEWLVSLAGILTISAFGWIIVKH